VLARQMLLSLRGLHHGPDSNDVSRPPSSFPVIWLKRSAGIHPRPEDGGLVAKWPGIPLPMAWGDSFGGHLDRTSALSILPTSSLAKQP
jgi:hypothetical protein